MKNIFNEMEEKRPGVELIEQEIKDLAIENVG
jgi:hypothetical protein